MRTQKPKLRRTISLEWIIELIECQHEDQKPQVAMDYFRKLPIYEVRSVCLKAMRDSFRRLEHLDWARETIENLIEAKDPSMAREVMDQYADAVRSEAENFITADGMYYYGGNHGATNLLTEFVQMLLFVSRTASITELFGPALKIVCQCVDPENFRWCYQHTELKPIHTILVAALNGVKGKYQEAEWGRAQRVLSLIVRVADCNYIDLIREIVVAHENGKAGPNFMSNFFHVANLAVLKETLRLLEQSPIEPQQQTAKVIVDPT